ncbi:hypothetical protein FPZ43_15760 [Mucilaginibacter pallidiroseus]|uniref:Uncharacterized protein n=1 Tax=Mucilaginibacter pallidiroseus TaxID=2599295 RepID=A0A563U312_9SPHI|nr:hypothetical protein [Mucilaginibacter pallidiroseus]TWR25741.1 hypothetical protein FPZ43_15760 [Mucilaginibacter pallidiroseus]
MNKGFANFVVCLLLALMGFVSACQKDDSSNTQAVDQKLQAAKADSALAVESPGNYLASTGSLKLKLGDSVYIFNASQDSVAFVSMNVGNNDYFGITAINKAHNLSFGISAKGAAATGVTRDVEGSQLLLNHDALHSEQYSLTQYTKPGDAGKIQLTAYSADTILARGTFFVFMAKDDKKDTPIQRVEGSFELLVKKLSK